MSFYFPLKGEDNTYACVYIMFLLLFLNNSMNCQKEGLL